MPTKVDWQQLLNEKRYNTSNVFYLRPESAYCVDSMKIIKSEAFQQLPEKTHIFPLDSWECSHSTLVHSLEVSYFAKLIIHKFAERNCQLTIGPKEIEKMSKTVSAAGLLYDIGVPAFGYCGEKTISKWFKTHLPMMTYRDRKVSEWLGKAQRYDLEHLNRHGQRLRVVRKLHAETPKGKLNLTYPILNSIIYVPRKSSESGKEHRLGYYQSETHFVESIVKELNHESFRHPLASIVEAASDITLTTSTIKEGLNKNIVDLTDLTTELEAYSQQTDLSYGQLYQIREMLSRHPRETQANQQDFSEILQWIEELQLVLGQHAAASFSVHYNDLAKGRYHHDLFFETDVAPLLSCLKRFCMKRILHECHLQASESRGKVVMTELLSLFVPLVLNLTDPRCQHEQKITQLILRDIGNTSTDMLNHECEGDDVYYRLLAVVDFLTSLTDQQALDLHQKLSEK